MSCPSVGQDPERDPRQTVRKALRRKAVALTETLWQMASSAGPVDNTSAIAGVEGEANGRPFADPGE
jgi:hypothetical protein